METLYTTGPAAYGSLKNLQKVSKLTRPQVETFLQGKNAHTKYRQFRRKFPRLKVIAYDINEIWSIDVAYVDKLAKYNNGVKYLLVAVDVLSRYLRVVPMRTKSSPDTAKAFAKMIEKVQPQKIGQTKEQNSRVHSSYSVTKKVLTPIQQPARQSRRLQSEIFDHSKILFTNIWKTNGHIITSKSCHLLLIPSTPE